MTTITITTTRGTRTGRYKVSATAPDGTCIGQAVDADEAEAVKRVRWQVKAWASDHGWESFVVKRQEPPSQ